MHSVITDRETKRQWRDEDRLGIYRWKRKWGSGGMDTPILNVISKKRGVASFVTRALYARGRPPPPCGTPWTGSWVGPTAGSDAFATITFLIFAENRTTTYWLSRLQRNLHTDCGGTRHSRKTSSEPCVCPSVRCFRVVNSTDCDWGSVVPLLMANPVNNKPELAIGNNHR